MKADNNVVYKYSLQPFRSSRQEVRMPMGAEILDAQFQDGQFVFWASIWDGYELRDVKENRHFVILYTGEVTKHRIRQHLATLQMHGLVYHIFEID
jgi:hypothetical protein